MIVSNKKWRKIRFDIKLSINLTSKVVTPNKILNCIYQTYANHKTKNILINDIFMFNLV